MRAAVIQCPQTISIVDADVPEPAPGQVLVRLSGSGICGSNLPAWEGRPWFEYPLPPGAPGHEGWGRVERLGVGVVDLQPDAPVAVLSQRAFAELDVADARELVPLPSALLTAAFPAEAIACGVNVMRRAKIQAGQRVAIVGIGFLGAVLVRLASQAGARVTALTRRPSALDVASDLGAEKCVRIGATWDTITQAKTANDNCEFDVVMEVTGLQAPLDIASHLTRTRGLLIIAGYHQDGPRNVDLQLWNWRGIDVINAHERDPQVYVDGMREAVVLVETGVLPLDRLVTHVFPITDAAAAFRCVAERPPGFLKAAVVTHAA
jgi:2-desacetyl-2-hydroxyethyl bacteriochlorophyllide A dehydrogenase